MYNSEDIAIRLDQSRLFIPDNAVFFTMPGYAVSSDTEQAFSVRHTQSMIDNRYLYCFNNSGTMFQKVSNVVLKACDNAGLSYDVYGLIKSGKLYLMVPSCVDLSNCIYTEIDKNGMEYNKVHADFTGDTDYQVTIGAISYSVTAMQSTLPTLYIEINEEYGTIDAMNTSEDHSVCAYGDLTLDVPQKLVDQYGWLPKYQSSESDAEPPGTVEVRGRGNSTWSTSEFRKKPYQIKTEKKIDLLGMGKAKTWCLIKDGGYFVGHSWTKRQLVRKLTLTASWERIQTRTPLLTTAAMHLSGLKTVKAQSRLIRATAALTPDTTQRMAQSKTHA